MVKVKNTLKKPLAVINFKKFMPEEIREVTNKEAKVLIRNPFLELVKPGKTKETKKEDNKNVAEVNKK